MGDPIYIYYLVGADSHVMTAINKCREKSAKFRDATRAFQIKHKAQSVRIVDQERLCGLDFDGEAPEGWRKNPSGSWYVPDSRTKLGKSIRREMSKLPESWTGREFSEMLGRREYAHISEEYVSWSSFAVCGDKVMLRVPEACEAKPEGCTELKMSEFYRIVEDHKAGISGPV